jgi:hypothetical protein
MSSVVISGDTSGAITVSAPLVAGTNTLTLQAATATSAVNKLETVITTTGGTSIDFTGIPSWVKRITVMFSGVSLSSTANILVQLGDSGGIENTGYLGGCTIQFVGTTAAANSTAGYIIAAAAADRVLHGNLIISAIGSNLWTASGSFGFSNAAASGSCGGSKTLSDTLTQLRITTTSTDTFDANGGVNILLEG